MDGGFISVVSGQKAGIAVMASTGGYSYLLVLLESPQGADLAGTRDTLYTEARNLLQWAFDSFAVRTVMEKGEIMEEVPVRFSSVTDHMPLATSDRRRRPAGRQASAPTGRRPRVFSFS